MDYDNLVTVQKDMLLVAEEINEIKKRKDIVEKIVGSKKKNDSDVSVFIPNHSMPCFCGRGDFLTTILI